MDDSKKLPAPLAQRQRGRRRSNIGSRAQTNAAASAELAERTDTDEVVREIQARRAPRHAHWLSPDHIANNSNFTLDNNSYYTQHVLGATSCALVSIAAVFLGPSRHFPK